MNYTVDTKKYTAGRTTVMGIAAILITWFHSTVVTAPGSVFGMIKMVSDIGVDMFLFASGVGLYFAVNKYNRYAAYLTARFRKVLVPYLLVSLVWGAYRYLAWGLGPVEILKNITLVDFWMEGNLSSWYIAVILALYLVTPVFVDLWKRHSWVGPVAFGAAIAGAVLVQYIPRWLHLEIFLFRVPVYLAGLWFGRAVFEERNVRLPVAATVLLLLAGGITVLSCHGYLPFVLPWGYKYLGYAPLAIGLSLLAAEIPHNAVTGFFGKRSLELYLVFEKVLEVFANNPRMEVIMGPTALVFNGVVLAVTLVCVELLRFACTLTQKGKVFRRNVDNPSETK